MLKHSPCTWIHAETEGRITCTWWKMVKGGSVRWCSSSSAFYHTLLNLFGCCLRWSLLASILQSSLWLDCIQSPNSCYMVLDAHDWYLAHLIRHSKIAFIHSCHLDKTQSIHLAIKRHFCRHVSINISKSPCRTSTCSFIKSLHTGWWFFKWNTLSDMSIYLETALYVSSHVVLIQY